MDKRTLLQGAAAALLLAGLGVTAAAQTFPNKPIRWVLGFPAGGANDFIARTVAVGLSRELGQPVVIDNKAGASGIIAAELVSKAPADGYTIFTVENGIAVNNVGLFKKLPYDPVKDFAPVGLIARFPMIIAAYPGSPYRDAKDLIEGLRKGAGNASYATPGVGTPHNLAMEMLKDSAHIDAIPVHYKGGAPGLQDAMGGQIALILTDYTTAGPLFRTGKLRPLGAFSKGGVAELPGLQSLVDLGYVNTEAYAWQGLVVPAGTPAAVRERMSQALQRTLKMPDIRAKLLEAGLEVTPSGPEEMRIYVEKERDHWLPLIRDKKISAEGA